MKRLPAATSEFVNLINLHRKLRTRLLWDTFQLILEGKEMMRNDETSNGSLSSPQWSHLFPKTGASVIESFPLIIQAVRYKTQNMLHISPYEVKSQWNFQDQKWFNVTIVLKSKASTNRSTPNPLPLLHPYLDFSSHFLRFAGKLFELLRHNGKTLLLPLCFGQTNSETVNSKDVLQHVLLQKENVLYWRKNNRPLKLQIHWGIRHTELLRHSNEGQWTSERQRRLPKMLQGIVMGSRVPEFPDIRLDCYQRMGHHGSMWCYSPWFCCRRYWNLLVAPAPPSSVWPFTTFKVQVWACLPREITSLSRMHSIVTSGWSRCICSCRELVLSWSSAAQTKCNYKTYSKCFFRKSGIVSSWSQTVDFKHSSNREVCFIKFPAVLAAWSSHVLFFKSFTAFWNQKSLGWCCWSVNSENIWSVNCIWKFRKFRSLKSFHPKPQGVAVQRLLGWPGSCKNSVSHESLSFLISILTKKQQKSKLQLDLPNEPVNDIWKHTGIAMPCWFNVS